MSSSIDAPSREYVAPPTAEAYLQMYRKRGKQFVIKASGKELHPDKLHILASQLQYLTAQGIHSILIFGGGSQIDAQWGARHPDVGRAKVDGVGITTEEVLHDAVIPAYWNIRAQLQVVLPDFHFIEPEDIPCVRQGSIRSSQTGKKVDVGWVGIPQGIGIPQGKNVAIGFLGGRRQLMNMNADAVARLTAQHDQAGEHFFLTPTGGVLNEQGMRERILLLQHLSPHGAHDYVRIDGGMRKKMAEVYAILTDTWSNVHKIAIINGGDAQDPYGLRREIEHWEGGGTLIFDADELQCAPLAKWQYPIVDSVRAQQEQDGVFVPRSEAQWEHVRREHRIVAIDDSPVGGFSLMPTDRKSGSPVRLKLEALWAGYTKNGLGKIIAGHAVRQAGQMGCDELWALAVPRDPRCEEDHLRIRQLYESYGFTCVGTVGDVQQRSDAPPFIRTYNTSEKQRNPYCFVRKTDHGPSTDH